MDVETTGLDPANSHIVEIAVVVIDELGGDGEPFVALHTRVRPPLPIPADATKIHGISDADVANAPTWAEVWPRVAEVLSGRIPCAFNVAYDFQMLRAECVSHEPLFFEVTGWGRWLDPMILVRGLDKFEKGKKLLDAARRRGIAVDPHGAAGDAMVTAMLLPQLVREGVTGRTDRRGMVTFRAPPHPTVGAWLTWQREQALLQERDLVEFFRSSGRREPIDTPWHNIEGIRLEQPEPQVPTTECKSCRAPIVWIVTSAGKRIPCDPAVLRAMPQAEVDAKREQDRSYVHPGRHVALTTDDGKVAWGYLEEGGSLVGRESHWATCPTASRHRT